MIYQLEAFERFIRMDIAPEMIIKDFSESKLKTHYEFAIREKDRISIYFRDKAIKGEPLAPIAKLVHAHQVGTNAIIEDLIGFTRSGDVDLPPEVVDFYFKVCLVIEDIITFLQQHLPDYFNEELPISSINALRSKEDLRKQLGTLQPIGQHPEMDKKLFRMITRPFREFIEEDKDINYRELGYLKDLVVALRRLLDYDSDDITYEVHLTLMELNFNYPRYVLYFNYWLDAKLSEIPDRSQRYDRLSWYIHAIEHVRFQPGCVLMPRLPSVTEQLLVSIRNTYRYLEKDQQIKHSVINQIERTDKPKNTKIKLAVSVPVLALFLKSLIKAGIIVNENKADVFRGVAENFTTLKSESISSDSLKGKYNKIPPSAYIHLKNVLARILATITKV